MSQPREFTAAVVIPFFQRERGVLRRSLESVLAQRFEGRLHVLIADDESPIAPEEELAALPRQLSGAVTILRQKNAGPGAARNLALDSAPADTDMVAFLDSDDSWTPDHLANAARAIAAGADLYFADWRREGEETTRYGLAGFTPEGTPLDEARPRILRCEASELFRRNLMFSPIGTSTVAFRRAPFADLRFRTEFRSAGEDVMFWQAMLARSPTVALSLDEEARYGRGVNVNAARVWGDLSTFRRLADEARLNQAMRDTYALDAALLAYNDRWFAETDRAFCMNLLSYMRRNRKLPRPALDDYLQLRPRALLKLPMALAAVAAARLTGRAATP